MGVVREFQVIENYRPERRVEAPISESEVESFARDGYVLLKGAVGPQQAEALRNATEAIAAAEHSQAGFSGIFLRHMMDKDKAFLDLLEHPIFLPLARIMLGPMVRVLPLTARIAVPGEPNQLVEWHIHQRLVPKPLPPFFSQPVVLDTLVYLDDVDVETGPLQVVPGSHLRYHDPIPSKTDDLEGQITLYPKAGDAIMMHGNLWHRALPTTERGHRRRLLILPFGPAWASLPSFGKRPAGGFLDQLAETGDADMKELLGDTERIY